MKHHIFRTAWAGILALSVSATLSSNVIAASREDTLVIVSGASVNSISLSIYIYICVCVCVCVEPIS